MHIKTESSRSAPPGSAQRGPSSLHSRCCDLLLLVVVLLLLPLLVPPLLLLLLLVVLVVVVVVVVVVVGHLGKAVSQAVFVG